jgi:hypothetical protein
LVIADLGGGFGRSTEVAASGGFATGMPGWIVAAACCIATAAASEAMAAIAGACPAMY